MSMEIYKGNSNSSTDTYSSIEGRASRLSKLISEENPKKMGVFFYIPESRFNRHLPEELNKNSILEVNFNKVQEYQKKLNDVLRTFPGNQTDVLSIVQEIDQFLADTLPEISNRISNETLVKLKRVAQERQSETIETQIDSVFNNRRNLLNIEEYNDTDPRKVNITFPDKLVEIAKTRIQMLKATSQRIRDIASTGLPDDEVSNNDSLGAPITTDSETIEEKQVKETIDPEKRSLSPGIQEFISELEQEMENDREEIRTLFLEYSKYLEQLNKILARINLKDTNYEREISSLRNLSNNKSLRQITYRLYPYFSKYTSKKLELEKLLGNGSLPDKNLIIQRDLENIIDFTNTEESRDKLKIIKDSYLISPEIKKELSRIL
jgi:hypothetical protein